MKVPKFGTQTVFKLLITGMHQNSINFIHKYFSFGIILQLSLIHLAFYMCYICMHLEISVLL